MVQHDGFFGSVVITDPPGWTWTVPQPATTTGGTAGMSRCPKCGCFYWPIPNQKHVCSQTAVSAPEPARRGWECPKCGCVYAPFVSGCERCNGK